MATRNDITGDAIRSASTKKYAENFERIFGKGKSKAEDKPAFKYNGIEFNDPLHLYNSLKDYLGY